MNLFLGRPNIKSAIMNWPKKLARGAAMLKLPPVIALHEFGIMNPVFVNK